MPKRIIHIKSPTSVASQGGGSLLALQIPTVEKGFRYFFANIKHSKASLWSPITSPQTMRFSIVVAIVAALTITCSAYRY
jgi:hypothetical protein